MRNTIMTIFLLLWGNSQISATIAVESRLVIGEDERIRILDTMAYPFQQIGQIGNFCTGSLITPNIVLTAAHCTQEIYNPYFNFASARNGKQNPLGIIGWEKIAIPSCYAQDAKKECDFAFIFLSEEVASSASFDLLHHITPEIPITITGYPADKIDQMWSSSCPAEVQDGRLIYLCDTFGGMSGAPIYQLQDGQQVLVGLHTRGEEGNNAGIVLNEFFKEIFDKANEVTLGTAAYPEVTMLVNPFLPQNELPNSSVYLQNNCQQSIVAKVLYKDIRGNLTKKIRIIGRKSQKLLDQVYGNEVFITFQTKSGNYVSYGNEHCGSGSAWPKCFLSYPLDLTMERTELQLNCPNK